MRRTSDKGARVGRRISHRTCALPDYRGRISNSACLTLITRLPFLEVAQALACDWSFYILKTF